MKKLQRRTLFVLLFILALAAGTVVLCAFYVKDGAQWASFYGQSACIHQRPHCLRLHSRSEWHNAF